MASDDVASNIGEALPRAQQRARRSEHLWGQILQPESRYCSRLGSWDARAHGVISNWARGEPAVHGKAPAIASLLLLCVIRG